MDAVPADDRPSSARATGFFSADLQRLGLVQVQVLCAVAAATAFGIQNEAFRTILIIVAIAFPVHHFLPRRLQVPAFAGLSVASYFVVTGVGPGLGILAIGLLIIFLSRLPIAFSVRVSLILAVVAALAVARAGFLWFPHRDVILVLLGSMFMFRLIVYLYDVRTEKKPQSLPHAIAYFFMAPNVCFPLFPVVDYKTFCKTHFDRDPFVIYQTGLIFIFRGIVQLVLYRAIYLYATIDAYAVENMGTFFRFAVANYLLYLNLSGMFHLIVGILHLFGFRLPETHDRYLLASSFSDFWRRINIYWKDFILKVFFYPFFMRFRKLGQTNALILATIGSFFFTWFFHSYQWFWLRGTVLFTPQDTLFWAILCLLVVINSLIQARSKKPKATADTNLLWPKVLLGLKTVGTFCTIIVLWSMWTAASMSEWFYMMRQIPAASPTDVAIVAAFLVGLGSYAVVRAKPKKLGERASKEIPLPMLWQRTAFVCCVTVLALAATVARVQDLVPGRGGKVLAALEAPQLSDQDVERMQRGYYEDLTQVSRFSHELSALYGERPADSFEPWKAALQMPHDSYLEYVLTPSTSFTYLTKTYTTNSHGMRDKEYALQPAPGVTRVALLGTSYTLGWGVGDEECYERIAEDALNETAPGAWEILNFSKHGYCPVRRLITLENEVGQFQPDAVVFASTVSDPAFLARMLFRAVQNGVPMPYPDLQAVVDAAGVDASMATALGEAKLEPYLAELNRWVYERVVSVCTERGITPIWMFVPQTRTWFADKKAELFDAARDAGFIEIIDLSPAFEGAVLKDLRLFEWDYHPNPQAHRLLAEEFTRAMRESTALRD